MAKWFSSAVLKEKMDGIFSMKVLAHMQAFKENSIQLWVDDWLI